MTGETLRPSDKTQLYQWGPKEILMFVNAPDSLPRAIREYASRRSVFENALELADDKGYLQIHA